LKRVCVITGASGRLGTAFIRSYRTQFQIVAIHNRHGLEFASQNQFFIDPLDRRRPIGENEDPIYEIRADLSHQKDIERICYEVIEKFQEIDLLINAAVWGAWTPLLSADALTDAESALHVNVLAPLRLAVGFARQFWQFRVAENIQRRRNIVNISSTAGVYVYPDAGQCLYSASKAALNFATYHLASEFWNIGVRVNALAPNSFPSRVPLKLVLEQIVAFDSGRETGRLRVVDG
jgi:NAD(P)-dependent dehydrogenase (short-subunit alcohol dehydrogenase family)